MNDLAGRSADKTVIGVLGSWFCFALAVGVTRVFQHAGAAVVALTVWGLAAVVLVACRKIQVLHTWIETADLRKLIAIHLIRFVGIYFLILGSRGELPNGFARPAGVGDIVIAIGAVLLLCVPGLPAWLRVLRLWNFFGFLDIAFVAFNALRFGLQDSQSMLALRSLPLSLLPMFFVPLIIASHILIFGRLVSSPKLQSAE